MTDIRNPMYLGQTVYNGQREDLVYGLDRHLVSVGPNGSGKGSSLIIPNVASPSLRRSMVIVDIKGEIAAVTAERRRNMGSKVVVINPFNVLTDIYPDLQSEGFNPLQRIDPDGETFADDATEIASAFVVESDERDRHWDEAARDLIAVLIMYEVAGGRMPTLKNVRDTLCGPRDVLQGLLRTISESKDVPRAMRNKATRLIGAEDNKELESVFSSARTHTQSLDSEKIAEDLSRGTFDFASMQDEFCTVYLILPAHELRTHGRWLRLMVLSALRPLLRSPLRSKQHGRVLMLLDEFAALQKLPQIEDAVGYARGYGVQLWMVLQDLGQVRRLYGEFGWQTFVGARGALTAFSPQDLFTADYLSKLCGQRSVTIASASHDLEKDRWQASLAAQTAPLHHAEALMRLGEGKQLCLLQERWPVVIEAPPYWQIDGVYDHPHFGRLRDNPYAPRSA